MSTVVTLGVDVSKDKLDAALWVKASRKWYAAKASNDIAGAHKLLEWVCAKAKVTADQCRVVLEATGVYHETVAQAFHDAGCAGVIANPKRVRDYAKGIGILAKADTVDARVLARHGSEVEDLTVWLPPPAEVRVLRALLARLDAVDKDAQRESNRLEKARATDMPQVIHESLARTLASLQAERERLIKAIDDHYDQHPGLKQDLERLKTIPGVGPATGSHLLCLLKRHRFDNARQAAACAGLNVLPYESGSSVHKPPRLSKHGDPRLRAKLYMAAIVASRHNPKLRTVYLDLIARGKSKMSALGALMRRIVHIAFGMLKHHSDFNPNISPKIA